MANKNPDPKAQSAMEYLMTYGWAILIIAVVLSVLFELGVFNPMTFAPKASPGSCRVVRPNGAGTTEFISLVGECNGELPQYVISTSPSGQNYVEYANFPLLESGNPMTVMAWIKPITNTSDCRGAVYVGSDCSQAMTLTLCGITNQVLVDTCGAWGGDPAAGFYAPQNQFSFIAFTVSGTTINVYYNGQNQSFTAASTPLPTIGNVILGDNIETPNRPSYAIQLADVQIYNSSLSANEIKALYLEGIGGAPIKIQNLVGWWPLNGNANDYSGNNNNGVPVGGVTYISNWYSGYSAP